MRRNPHRAVATTLVLAAWAVAINACATESASSLACPDLAAWAEDGVEIGSAEVVAATTRLPAHCRVAGVVDETINFELLLPATWNGKLAMGGGGGFVGSVVNAAQDGLSDGPTALERGYATVGTDTGHTGTVIDGSWALDDPRAEENFAHRAVHRTAEASKALIRAHYGEDAERSYFLGCSRGGGQALIAAQRYPDDFDGIVAGAPALDWPGVASAMVRTQQAIYPDPTNLAEPVISDDNRALLATATIEACDQIDGVADGIIDDPGACPFRPEDLPRCSGDPGADCVTAAQLAAIRTVYEPLVIDGRQVYPGFPFGGEIDPGGWDAWITGPRPGMPPGVPTLHYAFGTEVFKYFVYDDPDWDYSTYDFSGWEEDTAGAASLLNSTSTDLSAFRDGGGRLILFHGWSDAALSARDSIEYYESVAAVDGATMDYFRLFLLPGVGHCAGGPGPDRVDWLAAIESWVEEGSAPATLPATKYDGSGTASRVRPLCPYPEVARYDDTGDPNDPGSFACAPPAD